MITRDNPTQADLFADRMSMCYPVVDGVGVPEDEDVVTAAADYNDTEEVRDAADR